jgi:hypothetical protein
MSQQHHHKYWLKLFVLLPATTSQPPSHDHHRRPNPTRVSSRVSRQFHQIFSEVLASSGLFFQDPAFGRVELSETLSDVCGRIWGSLSRDHSHLRYCNQQLVSNDSSLYQYPISSFAPLIHLFRSS